MSKTRISDADIVARLEAIPPVTGFGSHYETYRRKMNDAVSAAFGDFNATDYQRALMIATERGDYDPAPDVEPDDSDGCMHGFDIATCPLGCG